jgi:ABC-type transporter Mla MlaB component
MSFAGPHSLYHVDCDLRDVARADVGTVGALARAHLNARRQGVRLRGLHASPELRELVAFAGLEQVLLGRDGRQPEEREEPLRVEERGKPDDLTV